MKTEYIHMNNQPHQTIRIDRLNDDEAIITVTNVRLSSIGDLINQLQMIERAERDQEPVAINAVLGAKPDPTAWYKNALEKAAQVNPQVIETPTVETPPMPKPLIRDGIINVNGIPTKVHKRGGKAVYGGSVNPRTCDYITETVGRHKLL